MIAYVVVSAIMISWLRQQQSPVGTEDPDQQAVHKILSVFTNPAAAAA